MTPATPIQQTPLHLAHVLLEEEVVSMVVLAAEAPIVGAAQEVGELQAMLTAREHQTRPSNLSKTALETMVPLLRQNLSGLGLMLPQMEMPLALINCQGTVRSKTRLSGLTIPRVALYLLAK